MKPNDIKKLLILVFLLLPALSFAAPAFHGSASIQMNIPPAFDGLDATVPFIRYGQLDKLGRATRAVGLLGPELIVNERASMSGLFPTGWRSDAYAFIDGNFLISHNLNIESLPELNK